MAESDVIIGLKDLTKRFGLVKAVNGINLDIRRNEFFALLGPSGCGKTTLLRMIGGFEGPSEGVIELDGEDIVPVQPNRRPINMVFQSYAVFPHMTVGENVAYGLKVAGVPRAEIPGRVGEALRMVKLEGYEDRRSDQLSGGQRQRVALARALVKRPKVLLLDEPLSALDAKLREAMQLELVRLQHETGITFIIVTHDQNEALSMADRIAVMNAGQVQQVATPAELYEHPANRFVAEFIGQINVFEGKVAGTEAAAGERAAPDRCLIDVPDLGRVAVASHGAAVPAGPVSVAVRPEKIRLDPEPPSQGRVGCAGEVAEIAYYGGSSHIFLTTEAGTRINANVTNAARDTQGTVRIGNRFWCTWDAADTFVLPE
jgi:spermidine/putrescine transport system ATP-binding protein/putrescine transport system ATP-binding protein